MISACISFLLQVFGECKAGHAVRKSTWLIGLTLGLVGCGSSGPERPSVMERTMNPDMSRLEPTRLEGLRRTASVGDMMTSSSPLVKVPTLKLKSEVTAYTSHKGESISVPLPIGDYLFAGTDNQGRYFRFQAPLQVHYVRQLQGFGGIYIPDDPAAQSAAYWIWDAPRAITQRFYVAYLPVTPHYSITERVVPPSNAIGLVTTLTYGGVAGGQIKFIYREYMDGIARMAFTQEVSLDYKPEQEYAYGNSRFIVHRADSVMVTYTLLKPL
jgi:hypothetical protein